MADRDNHAIRTIDTDGNVATLAGTGTGGHKDGAGDQAMFFFPQGVAFDPGSHTV